MPPPAPPAKGSSSSRVSSSGDRHEGAARVPTPAVPFRLIAISDRHLGEPDFPMLSGLGAALLFRDKDMSPEERRRRAEVLSESCRESGVPLLIHGDVDLARMLGALGVPLPSSALPQAQDDLLVGRSCHNQDELNEAASAGLDYATLSPVLASPGKGSGMGWEAFARLAQSSSLPLFALGGLGPDHLSEARRHGAWGVAGIRAFYSPSRR